MERFLVPQGKKVLKQLQTLVLRNQKEHWYTIFLGSFILLHSYELMMGFIRRHAEKRKAPVSIVISFYMRTRCPFYDARLILDRFGTYGCSWSNQCTPERKLSLCTFTIA